uniref:Peptidase M1 membrane alanine aminopeptidase domain-containing protein n=1 Tax=Quercus lobata TaxID=97700 RepID=A0A7N2LMQ2_QUELO
MLTFVVSCEVAHQWFGNPVTIEWSYLWLNEGFATWLVAYVWIHCNHILVRWRNTMLIQMRKYDAISYKKGSIVIQMLQGYLGADIFQVCYKVVEISGDAIPDSVKELKRIFINIPPLLQCCIAYCPDPSIVLEFLNFMLSDEVFAVHIIRMVVKMITRKQEQSMRQ